MKATFQDLQELVDEAYRVFRGPTPQRVGVCTGCCMDPSQARALLVTEVRAIPLPLMREWMDAATAFDFPGETWLHLLPRILDLLAAGEDPTFVGQVETAGRDCVAPEPEPEGLRRMARRLRRRPEQARPIRSRRMRFHLHVVRETHSDVRRCVCVGGAASR